MISIIIVNICRAAEDVAYSGGARNDPAVHESVVEELDAYTLSEYNTSGPALDAEIAPFIKW
jgi:hypothetical protein